MLPRSHQTPLVWTVKIVRVEHNCTKADRFFLLSGWQGKIHNIVVGGGVVG